MAIGMQWREVVVAFEGVESKKPLSGVVAEVRSDAEVEADSAVTPGAVAARMPSAHWND